MLEGKPQGGTMSSVCLSIRLYVTSQYRDDMLIGSHVVFFIPASIAAELQFELLGFPTSLGCMYG